MRHLFLLNRFKWNLQTILHCLFIFSAFLFENSEGIKPTVGTVTSKCVGIIKADNQYTVYSTVNGILQKNKIAGQPISQGSCFWTRKRKAELSENARLAYQLSRGESRYIKDKITEMELKVQSARINRLLMNLSTLEIKKLSPLKASPKLILKDSELAFKSSKLNYESLKSN
jgi:hypothetical protein